MNFKIGDTIVHWTYGLGTVVGLDQKDIAGKARQYYIVRVGHLDIWVPIEDEKATSIRFPTESGQFKALLQILRESGGELPKNQYQRKTELRERMQERTLVDLCHVIRDLTELAHQHPLNFNDSSVLLLAEELLLDEWVIALGAERSTAQRELKGLLKEGLMEQAPVTIPENQ